MRYHLLNRCVTVASFKYKGDRDDVRAFWINQYGDDTALTAKDDTFEEFADACGSRCFGGCMRDTEHRKCQEGICRQWEKA